MTETKKPKPTQIVTGPVRIFYAQLVEPKANDQGKLKFSCQPLIKKSDKATLAAIERAVKAAEAEYAAKFGGGKLPANLRRPLRDGDAEFESGEKKDKDYKGHFFLNCSSGNRPDVLDINGDPIIEKSEIYSGMFARLIINFYPYNTAGNKGVAAGLNGVQKVRDGEPKSGVGSANELFGRYESNDEDEVDPLS